MSNVAFALQFMDKAMESLISRHCEIIPKASNHEVAAKVGWMLNSTHSIRVNERYQQQTGHMAYTWSINEVSCCYLAVSFQMV